MSTEFIDNIESPNSVVETTIKDIRKHNSESENINVTSTKDKKYQKAIGLIEQARQKVEEINQETESCKLLLEDDFEEYEKAKQSLRAGGYDACVLLIDNIGYKAKSNDVPKESKVIFESKEEIKPIAIKNISSGKFTGFLLSLLGGTATAVGLLLFGAKKLDIVLDMTRVPSAETMEKIIPWFSKFLGFKSDIYLGLGIFIGFSVFVMIVIYILRVFFKGNKNLRFALMQLEEAELYVEAKENCKIQMDKMNAHVKEVITLLKKYEVVFNEQKGKLERILYIEGPKEGGLGYHEKSSLEIHDTQNLLEAIQDFMATPILDGGKLSEKSVHLLENIGEQIDKVMKRFY